MRYLQLFLCYWWYILLILTLVMLYLINVTNIFFLSFCVKIYEDENTCCVRSDEQSAKEWKSYSLITKTKKKPRVASSYHQQIWQKRTREKIVYLSGYIFELSSAMLEFLYSFGVVYNIFRCKTQSLDTSSLAFKLEDLHHANGTNIFHEKPTRTITKQITSN